MKFIPEILAAAAVISIIGYVLVSSVVWIVILIICLVGSVTVFLLDQAHKTRG